jgi:hypothetical protein
LKASPVLPLLGASLDEDSLVSAGASLELVSLEVSDDELCEDSVVLLAPLLLPQAAVTIATLAAIAATAIHVLLRIRAPIWTGRVVPDAIGIRVPLLWIARNGGCIKH